MMDINVGCIYTIISRNTWKFYSKFRLFNIYGRTIWNRVVKNFLTTKYFHDIFYEYSRHILWISTNTQLPTSVNIWSLSFPLIYMYTVFHKFVLRTLHSTTSENSLMTRNTSANNLVELCVICFMFLISSLDATWPHDCNFTRLYK